MRWTRSPEYRDKVLFDASHSTHNGSSVRDRRYCANQDATNDFPIPPFA